MAIQADAGENLLEVIHRAGVPIEAECGGQGTCDSCVAIIIDGECRRGPKILDEGVILTCQAEVSADITLKVSDAFKPVEAESSIADSTLASKTTSPEHISPLSIRRTFTAAPDAFTANTSDLEIVSETLFPGEDLTADLQVLRDLPQAIRSESGKSTVIYSETENGKKLISISGGHHRRNNGLACDVGTTTIVIRLIDLDTAAVIDSISGYNGQIQCGSDIISRIIYSQKPGRLSDLKDRVLSTINRLISDLRERNNTAADDITSAVFAGNTTMTHLLLGIDPANIREAPYTPVMNNVPAMSGLELGIEINPDAVILCSPGAGSYLGGDITAGILALKAAENLQGINLFLDIGTNGEMVILGDDWMAGCACSAGPAFEGVGISCGMRAAAGAIDFVKIDIESNKIDYNVIGEMPAQGICGSGLLELTAGLFTTGIIGKDGKFTGSAFTDRIEIVDNRKRLLISEGDGRPGRKEVFITEHDIANIIRAKAAIFSACTLLLKKLGLSIADIEHIYVAGGFGKKLNVESAVQIGFFPDIPRSKFTYLGNTSLTGAGLSLISADHRAMLKEITKSMTYIDLSSEPGYMNEYTAALFLPHTDTSLFPSQK